MKKNILTLGILLEICFLSFYAIKYLMKSWGVERLFLAEPRIFALTFTVLSVAVALQAISAVLVYKKGISYKYILIFSIIFNLSLLFVWNIGSNDLYTHIQRGRMVAHYGANPYTVAYDSFSFDKFYSEIRTIWSGQLSIYGPVFTLFGALISYIARDSLLAHIIIYKLVYSAFNILTGFFIYKITKNSLAALLYSWSPLVIFEIQANNHFEILSVFPIVVSIYLLLSRVGWKRYVLAISLLTVGSLTKYFGFVGYPFFILFAFKKLKSVKDKMAFLFVGGLIQLAIVGLSYLPFLDNMGILDGFFSLAKGKFISPSIAILLLGQPVAQSIFKIYYFILSIKAFFSKFVERRVFVGTLVLVFAGFTLVYLNLVLPWYTLTLFTLLSIYYGLAKEKKYIIFAFILQVYSFLIYLRIK